MPQYKRDQYLKLVDIHVFINIIHTIDDASWQKQEKNQNMKYYSLTGTLKHFAHFALQYMKILVNDK